MSLKIILACHKPCYLIKENGYIPVHVGRALASIPSSNKRENEFFSNCIGDNETDVSDGEISSRNKSLNEMTMIYWAWKNYEKIGNPEYIGIGHYRRQFIFNRMLPRPKRRWLLNARVYVFPDCHSVIPYIDVNFAENLLKDYDMLATEKYDAACLLDDHVYTGCKSRFYAIADFNPDLYDLMEKLVLESHPDFLPELETLGKKAEHYLFNMFVMKKADFFKYCEFIFPILFKLDEANSFETRVAEKRAPGFLAEFLTSMFISHCERVEGTKVKTLDTTFVDYTDELKAKPTFKEKLEYYFASCIHALTFGKRGGGRMKKLRERWKLEF